MKPVSRLIEDRAVELAVHGWDIRYGMDSTAKISETAVPLLKEWMGRRIRIGVQNADVASSPARYRFQLDDPVTESYDLVIGAGDVSFGPSDDAGADVTFRCDTNTYLLFAMGRLPFTRAVRRGRLSFEATRDWHPASSTGSGHYRVPCIGEPVSGVKGRASPEGDCPFWWGVRGYPRL